MSNNTTYSWNPVFNFIMDIKREMQEQFGEISYEEKTIVRESGSKQTISCVENWARLLGNEDYLRRLTPLHITQNGNLVLFRYTDHIGVKEGNKEYTSFDNEFWELYEGFYRECRSVVIDVLNEVVVIAPFKKFMNLNQNEEYSLDNVQRKMEKAISTHKPVEITSKLDGSMQCATYYRDNVIMSGAQAIDKNKSWRLQDGFERLMSDNNLIKMIKENMNLTFIFEYISLKDAHVVRYTQNQEGLYLIGIRENYTGRQWSYKEVLDIAENYKIKLTTDLHKETLSEVLGSLDKYKSSEAEGVVLNIDGFLVKIKYDDYVKCYRLISAISSPNLIIEAYADGWIDDLIAKIPITHRWRIEGLIDILHEYCWVKGKNIDQYYREIYQKTQGEIADFMKEVQKYPKEDRVYIIRKYKSQPINFLKKHLDSKTPHYKTLSELGLQEDYEEVIRKQSFPM